MPVSQVRVQGKWSCAIMAAVNVRCGLRFFAWSQALHGDDARARDYEPKRIRDGERIQAGLVLRYENHSSVLKWRQESGRA